MVTLIGLRQNDVFWDQNVNYHIYEEAERAKGNNSGVFGPVDQAGADHDFEMRIAKAKALDQARRNLIRAAHDKEQDVFPVQIGEAPKTRTIDGAEITSADLIKL